MKVNESSRYFRERVEQMVDQEKEVDLGQKEKLVLQEARDH